MAQVEQAAHPERVIVLEFYQCDACGRKGAVWWEIEKGSAKNAQGWVEKEVAARGSFFPSDWTGSSGSGRFGR